MPSLGRELNLMTPFKGVKQFAEQAKWNLMATHNVIIMSRVVQTAQANRLCSDSPEYKVGDLVYLSTDNLSLPKGRAKKLRPKYIGLYKVLEAHYRASTVRLELPVALVARCITPTFHASLIKPHIPNDDKRFPHHYVLKHYDFGQEAKEEWFVDEIIAHQWQDASLELQVRWSLGDTTWEPLANCKQLEALDAYLELQGVISPKALPRRI
jgi:hypothetical protein